MAREVNLHSQLVGWLKILLPLGALMLLSTLFLFARAPASSTDIPFADIDVAAREQRIGTPRLSGLTDTGDTIQISAEAARPDAQDAATLQIDRPRLTLDATDGSTLTIASGQGRVERQANRAVLSGLARAELSTGYQMETSALTADLASGVIVSDGALEIQAPFGQLTAGQATIDLGKATGGATLRFEEGVRLVFQPARIPEE
ncbi:hypothetical protein EU805_01905 [Salipiger sp. IMCC34102]|uniref:LPS export ABC transporter periplasmic protein LptC n=1 Tax=Salipiger sp. IMCC34102 TaxID=2510647 RepID=UPI00101C0B84|nr:LPS export ABC transporter periplasmic protein LptC [Salipiger sp. IMCC34102]RYH04149.1 hypothetical protein EU805_01905 [Salipiger sp. IMCC34102]